QTSQICRGGFGPCRPRPRRRRGTLRPVRCFLAPVAWPLSRAMRIAIVNDLTLAREVRRRLVLSVPGNAGAWAAANGEEAVRKAAADRPAVILMALVLPKMAGA